MVWKHNVDKTGCHLSLAIDMESKTLFTPLGSTIAAIQYGESVESIQYRGETLEEELESLRKENLLL